MGSNAGMNITTFEDLLNAARTQAQPQLRISAIVDARFSLIVDGETASSRVRRGGAQALGLNVAQSSTISLKRCLPKGLSGLVLGLN